MTRVLLAFVRLRFWTFRNSIRLARRQGPGERLARTAEIAFLPLAALALLPALAGLAALGWAAGRALPGSIEVRPLFLHVGGVVLLVTTVAVLAAPLFRSLEETRMSHARLRLLPLEDRMLHALVVAGALTEPWILAVTPALGLLAVSLATGGAVAAAAVATVAGAALLAALAAIRTLATFVLQLLLRGRRRGELLVLVGFAALITLPNLFAVSLARRGGVPIGGEGPFLPGWGRVLPSELFLAAIASAAAGEWQASAAAVCALLGLAGILLWLSRRAYDLAVATPAAAARRKAKGTAPSLRIPGVAAGVAALGRSLERQLLRTVRGRMLVYLTPIIAVLGTALVLRGSRNGPLEDLRFASSWVLMLLAIALTQLASVELLVNPFGLQGTGLNRALLAPLSDLELVDATRLGGLLLCARAWALTLGLGAVFLRPGIEALLGALLVGVASHALAAPALLALGAVLPVRADLSRLGGAGAHPIASVVASLWMVVVGILPCLLLVGGRLAFGRGMGLLFCGSWTLLALFLGRLLRPVLAELVGARRESLHLAMLAR